MSDTPEIGETKRDDRPVFVIERKIRGEVLPLEVRANTRREAIIAANNYAAEQNAPRRKGKR